jgi:hypothetical protein
MQPKDPRKQLGQAVFAVYRFLVPMYKAALIHL